MSKVSNLTIRIPSENEISYLKYPKISINRISENQPNKHFSWNDVKISNNLCKKIIEKAHCIIT